MSVVSRARGGLENELIYRFSFRRRDLAARHLRRCGLTPLLSDAVRAARTTTTSAAGTAGKAAVPTLVNAEPLHKAWRPASETFTGLILGCIEAKCFK